MKLAFCYIKSSKIDEPLAEMFGYNPNNPGKGMTPEKIASLRGQYDEWATKNGKELLFGSTNANDITDEQLDDAFDKLYEFRASIGQRTKDILESKSRDTAECWDILRHTYNYEQRRNRIYYISRLFSSEVDRLTKGRNVSRQAVVNGFRTTGPNPEYVGGEVSILEGVYNHLLDLRYAYWYKLQNAKECFDKDKELGILNFFGAPTDLDSYEKMLTTRFNEFTKMLENWSELLPFVLRDLLYKEGIKMGVKKEYAAVASSDNFGDNDIASKWEISESVRDGWQRNNDLESSYASLGQEVRKAIADLIEIEAVPKFKRIPDGFGKVRTVFEKMEYKPKKDDLGNNVYMDPIIVHQRLMEFLRGVRNSESMMKRLCKLDKNGNIMKTDEGYSIAKETWMQPILYKLDTNPQFKTQFFRDFRKGFQPYSVMWEEKERGFIKGIQNIKTRLLNKAKNLLASSYEMLIGKKQVKFPVNVEVWGIKPIFDEECKMDWDRFAELRDTVLSWVTEEKVDANSPLVKPSSLTSSSWDNTVSLSDGTYKVDYDMKRVFLMEVFTSLGYDIEMDTVDSILHSRDIYEVRKQLEYLFEKNDSTTGILSAVRVKSLDNNNLDKLKKSNYTFRSIYNTQTGITSNGEKIFGVKEHSQRLLEIISKHKYGARLESRVRYNDNTLYSSVNPCYLSDKLEELQSYVDTNDKKGLLQYLENEYLHDPYFVDGDGKILNTWLQSIVDACNNPKMPLIDSVASIFTYERDLGWENKEFEDFTSKDHCIDMFIHFFADEKQQKGYSSGNTEDLRKKLSALYPVFILGDAGVNKYIRGPRICSAVRIDADGKQTSDPDKAKKIAYRFDSAAEDEILEGFWNVYMQEHRKLNAQKEILELYANGKKVGHHPGQFTMLTFLNKGSKDYSSDYEIPESRKDDKEFVKGVIRKYLNDAALGGINHSDGKITPSFKARMQELGVLETVDTKKGKLFKYINGISSTDENEINSKIREFYWNTKLATIQQLQLMTVDPCFYHGTKDLQKRYKEIHAPGTVLDVNAEYEDETGRHKYSEDGMETCIYFNDITLNTETSNPEFMETIFRVFATEKSEEEVERAIKDGLLKPLEDKEAEKHRRTVLSTYLGKNYNTYKSYFDNTLTDGQGYRTLTSYRKVMGMAGMWYPEMEEAYKYIMNVRASHTVRDTNNPNKIIRYTQITPEELKKINEYALILQPIKPYMFTHEKYKAKINKTVNGKEVIENGKPVEVDAEYNIPVQHKYSEALIIPELLPEGHKLRDLAFWMDENNVDMAGSTKIAKVGCFGAADLSNVKSKEDLYKALSPTREGNVFIHKLSYGDYRIQTNVPEHINSSQLFGTQIRKLIMAGLSLDSEDDFYRSYLEGVSGFEGFVNLSTDDGATNTKVSLRGRNLLALYNSLISANIFDSFDKFAENARDIEKLAELLQQSTICNTRESMDNIMSYVVTGNEKGFEKFLMPLFEGGLEHDTAALILSTFKKIVNKQQISGGSCVQASAFGISGYEEDGGLRFVTDPDNNKNILYAEIEMPFDKSFIIDVKNPDGTTSKQTVHLEFDRYCNPDGTLKLSDKPIEIPKYTANPRKDKNGKLLVNPEWKKYQSYTYKEVDGKLVACKASDPGAKVYKPLIEEEYPDILSIIAYRIPTEKAYSMLNCRIKRFTAKIAGGTMKVPPEGTTIAGFDFDIDKLYFMQREYHKHYKDSAYTEKNYSPELRFKVWGKFYDKHQDIRHLLEDKRALEALKHKDDPNFVVYDKYHKPHYKKTLNSYWDECQIEEKFGIKKGDAFMQTAKDNNYNPDQIVSKKGESYEYFETYDFSKTPEQNTRAARNNLLIDIVQARLMDPSTMQQRYTPGGFANASDAALKMRILQFGDLDEITTNGDIDQNKLEKVVAQIKDKNNSKEDPEPNYDPTDPYTILVYNQQNQIASKLIGVFANQNTNHAFSSLMDEFELNEPISFCGKEYKDLLHKKDPIKAAEIDFNVAEFLAASVDAVKDPVLNFLNFNTITADAGALLARLGYTTEEIGVLFNQPIIKKVCQQSLNEGYRIDTAINNGFKFLTGKIKTNSESRPNLSYETLASELINSRRYQENGKSSDDYIKDSIQTQTAVLQLFNDIIKASKDVSEFVTKTKFTAANAVPSTFGGLYAQQMAVDNYVSKFPKGKNDKGDLSYKMTVVKGSALGMFNMPIDNVTSYIDLYGDDKASRNRFRNEWIKWSRYNPYAFEQAMYDTNRLAMKLLSKYYPYENDMYVEARDFMAGLSRTGLLNEDTINDIHRHIPVALLAMQKNSIFDGEAIHKKNDSNTEYTNREYYRDVFAKDLYDILATNPDLEHLPIFEFLIPSVQDVPDIDPKTGEQNTTALGVPLFKQIASIRMQDVGGLGNETKELIRESWASLVEVDDNGFYKNPEAAQLAKDLFMYCFYQMGFDFSPISFMHLAPTAVKENIIVERNQNADFNLYDGVPQANTNDILVWSDDVFGAEELAESFCDIPGSLPIGRAGDSFRLPSKLTVDSIKELIKEAKSEPYKRFKIYKNLTEDEVKLLTKDILGGMDIPSNVYFIRETQDLLNRYSSEIFYGRQRTYRDFLNDILDNKEHINIDDFARMFILNNVDNPAFITDLNRTNDRVKSILFNEDPKKGPIGILKRPSNSVIDTESSTGFRSTIEIDLSSFTSKEDMEALSDLVNVTIIDGNIMEAKWKPCIKVEGAYYMAKSELLYSHFNINKSYKMVYEKVSPFGTSKKTFYDNNESMTAQMRYMSSWDVAKSAVVGDINAEVNPDNPLDTNPNGGTQANVSRAKREELIIDSLIKAYKRYGGLVAENVEQFKLRLRESLNTYNDDEILEEIERINKACKDGDEVLMLDSDGQMMYGC